MRAPPALAAIVAALVLSSAAAAAPSLTAGATGDHRPVARWADTPGECVEWLELTRAPRAVDEQGFWATYVVSREVACGETEWTGPRRLRPGRYYARVAAYPIDDEFPDTPIFSNVASFQVPYWPDRQFALGSVNRGAVPPGYTYRGDIVRAAARDLNGAGRSLPYRVCVRANRRDVCVRKRMRGVRWSAWDVRIDPAWAGFNSGRYTRTVVIRWYVGGRLVEVRRLTVWQ